MTQLAPHDVSRLIAAATEVRLRARAPYSGFAVGAAVIAEDGRIYAGCNVENASYGLSICAERNAVAAAVAAGVERLAGVAVVTDVSPPVAPCGACRQVLAELGDFPVVLANLAGEQCVSSVGELLPFAFSAADLVGARHP